MIRDRGSGHCFSVTGRNIGEAGNFVFKVGMEGEKLEFYGRWESLHLPQPLAEAAHRLHLRDNMHLVLRREESP